MTSPRTAAFVVSAALMLAASSVLLFPSRASADPARVGKFTEALLQVTFSDQSDGVHAYSVATVQQAGNEMSAFYHKLSYNKLTLITKAARVKLGNTTAYYEGHCDTDIPNYDHCFNLTQDAVAAQKSIDPSFFNGVDAVMVIIPGGFHSFTIPPLSGVGTPVDPVEAAYIEEGTLMAPPGFGPCCPSLVFWGGWAHELGHQLQHDAHLNIGGKWNGHPSGYNSGYDLMDSCYPCGQAPYGLLGVPYHNDDRGAYSGWLDPSHVFVMPPPTGPTGMTFTLPALSQTISNPVTQAVEVQLDSKRSFYVNVRTRSGDDAIQNHAPSNQQLGINDQGVQIEYTDDNADPPMTVCSPVPPGSGCVPNPTPTIWPYPLWHVGNTMLDNTNDVSIRVVGKVTNGYTVQINQGVPPGRPNLYMIPWLTPPMNTYETQDIWVDSSCNGYEDQGGLLRYGRRADGTVIGSGDDPCVNHENRIYATIHNGGQVLSSTSTVQFEVTNPLGVGPSVGWTTLGTMPLPQIQPGKTATVYIPWTPIVNLTPAQIAEQRFAFHSCIRVTVAPSISELILTDNQAQENIDYFEARSAVSPRPHYGPIHRQIGIRNIYGDQGGGEFDPHRLYVLESRSLLPRGWHYMLNSGAQRLNLMPNEFRLLPVDVIPGSAPVGRIYTFDAQAFTHKTLHNPALPPSDPHYSHFSWGNVGGATIAVHTVFDSSIDIKATTIVGASVINVQGQLKPMHQPQKPTIVALDYTDSTGHVTTRLVTTSPSGAFSDQFQAPNPPSWQVRAIWQGDMIYSSGVSPLVHVTPGERSRFFRAVRPFQLRPRY